MCVCMGGRGGGAEMEERVRERQGEVTHILYEKREQ